MSREPKVGEAVVIIRPRGAVLSSSIETTIDRLTRTQIIVEIDGKERRFRRTPNREQPTTDWHTEITSRPRKATLIRSAL